MLYMHRAKYGERAQNVHVLQSHHFRSPSGGAGGSTTRKLSKLSSLGFLWRPHYIVMID